MAKQKAKAPSVDSLVAEMLPELSTALNLHGFSRFGGGDEAGEYSLRGSKHRFRVVVRGDGTGGEYAFVHCAFSYDVPGGVVASSLKQAATEGFDIPEGYEDSVVQSNAGDAFPAQEHLRRLFAAYAAVPHGLAKEGIENEGTRVTVNYRFGFAQTGPDTKPLTPMVKEVVAYVSDRVAAHLDMLDRVYTK